MKKILIFSNEFPPNVGGAGAVAEQSATALSKNGYSVTVLTRSCSGRIDELRPYRLVEVKAIGKLWFLAYRKSINFDDFDLIVLNDPAAIYVAGLFFNRELLNKSIALLHGSEPEQVYLRPRFSYRVSFFKYFYTAALLKVKRIVAVSQFMKEKFLSKTGLLNLESKMVVNYAGIDLENFQPRLPKDLKENLGLPSNSQLLISVSRVVKMKGYPRMLDIFEQLIQFDDLFYWIVIGNGEYLCEFEEQLKHRGLQDRVFLLGAKPRSTLSYYYSNADLFWLLSEYEESFGLSYLEAQACGCPVVGYDRAGVKESVYNTKSGFLVDDCEDVVRVLLDRGYVKLDKEDILFFATQFNLVKQVRSLVSFVL